MSTFPPINRTTAVSAEDMITAIDFVNRTNWLFETWDVEGMISTFLPDGVAYHFKGTIKGHSEMRVFLQTQYRDLVPGVSRHSTNHIVDVDEDGVEVRYQNLLIRHVEPAGAKDAKAGKVLQRSHLPAIWIYSSMRDRLRRTPEGWKIFERHIGASTQRTGLDPGSYSHGVERRIGFWDYLTLGG